MDTEANPINTTSKKYFIYTNRNRQKAKEYKKQKIHLANTNQKKAESLCLAGKTIFRNKGHFIIIHSPTQSYPSQ